MFKNYRNFLQTFTVFIATIGTATISCGHAQSFKIVEAAGLNTIDASRPYVFSLSGTWVIGTTAEGEVVRMQNVQGTYVIRGTLSDAPDPNFGELGAISDSGTVLVSRIASAFQCSVEIIRADGSKTTLLDVATAPERFCSTSEFSISANDESTFAFYEGRGTGRRKLINCSSNGSCSAISGWENVNIVGAPKRFSSSSMLNDDRLIVLAHDGYRIKSAGGTFRKFQYPSKGGKSIDDFWNIGNLLSGETIIWRSDFRRVEIALLGEKRSKVFLKRNAPVVVTNGEELISGFGTSRLDYDTGLACYTNPQDAIKALNVLRVTTSSQLLTRIWSGTPTLPSFGYIVPVEGRPLSNSCR